MLSLLALQQRKEDPGHHLSSSSLATESRGSEVGKHRQPGNWSRPQTASDGAHGAVQLGVDLVREARSAHTGQWTAVFLHGIAQGQGCCTEGMGYSTPCCTSQLREQVVSGLQLSRCFREMSFVGQGTVEGDAEVHRSEVVLQCLAIHQDCEFASCSCILQVKGTRNGL